MLQNRARLGNNRPLDAVFYASEFGGVDSLVIQILSFDGDC